MTKDIVTNSKEQQIEGPLSLSSSPSPKLINENQKKSNDKEKKKKKSVKPVYEEFDYTGISESDVEILKAQVEIPETNIGYFSLFRYATWWDKLLFFTAALASIISGAALPLFTLVFGSLTQVFTDFFVYGTDPKEFQRVVNHNTLYFVYLGVGIFVASFIQTYLHIDRGEVIAARIRTKYLESVLRQNIAYFDRVGAGEVTSRITSDVTQIQDGISEKVGLIFSGVATFIAAFVIGFIKSWKMAFVMSSTVFAILFGMGTASVWIVKYTTINLSAYGEASSIAEDVLSSIRNTVAFGSQDRLAKKFENKLENSLAAGISRGRVIAVMVAWLWGIIYLSYGLAFWQGSRFIVSGDQTVGDLVTVVMAILIGAFSLGGITPSFQAVGSAVGAAHKIYEAIDRTPYIDSFQDDVGEKPSDFQGEIVFKNVRFTYPSRPNVPILENFNLEINPGETVALVGSSGSGKSTIIGLLERFYSSLGGSILIDGRPIENINIKWLRRQMALVSQEPTLFSVTIYENIAYGLIGTEYENADDSVKREMIINACREANAWDFIQTLTDGLDTEVGERGFLLSGGQKQRIAIARAIVSQPKLLLLDEATSALDTKSEGIVQEALDRALKSRTTIVIAHRLSTIKDANKIVVMSKGEIVEIGTHQELLKKQGIYYGLVQAQNIRNEEEEEAAAEIEKQQIEDEFAVHEKFAENAPINEKLALEKTFTNSSTFSRSNNVIKDLENQGFYDKAQQSRSSWGLVVYLTQLISQFNILLVIGILAACVCGAGYPIMSYLYGKVINALMVPPSEYSHMRHSINIYAGCFIALAGVEFLAFNTLLGCLTYHSEQLVHNIRLKTFKHYLRMDISFFDDDANSTGSLTSTLSKDGQAVEGFGGSTLGQVMVSLSVLLGGVIMAIVINWRLGLVCTATVPVLIGCGFLRIQILVNIEERAKKSYEKSGNFACEGVSAIRTVASLTREESVCKIYKDNVEAQVKRSRYPLIYSALVYGASQGLVPFVMGLGFWYGSTLMRKGQSSSYEFFTAFSAVIFGAQSAGQIFSYAPSIGKARQAAQNVARVLDIQPNIDSTSPEGDILENTTGNIEFQDVHFRYPTRRHVPVLRGINLKVKQGQFVALVGPSGCGKSTTISLIEMFYRPLLGKILLDGVDISTLNVSHYRSHIGLVQQEPVLYQGTIKENILLGLGEKDADEVSDEVIYAAARKANIHDFILSLPDGYETLCGAKGTLLSGGQKQRIAIARALIRNPKVLLLDEATSALDSESEKVVQAALDQAAKGRTTIAVAHRLSTIQNADIIYVFDQGRIVEQGNHEQLVEKRGIYYQLVKMQDLEKN